MIAAADVQAVQSLVLRAPHGPAVAHVLLTVPDDCDNGGCRALRALAPLCPTFGPRAADQPFCSIGFSFAGLERIGLPHGYLGVLRQRAPAFSAGGAARSGHCGDGFANAAEEPWSELAPSRAHVLVTLHGPRTEVDADAARLVADWQHEFKGAMAKPPPHAPRCRCADAALTGVRTGERLGAPSGHAGEWVHFGLRDGLSEICIDDALPRPAAPDCRQHVAGTLLLGHLNGDDFNDFALAEASDKVRDFFRNSSFGVLRPMQQQVAAFEEQVERWAGELSQQLGRRVSCDFVKAKLGGRWPAGQLLRPGEFEWSSAGDLEFKLDEDDEGAGCPFGSHVRRMRAAPDGSNRIFDRPLQRRSFPFGSALWRDEADVEAERGLIGHFFCASIEDQFEHLLGEWGARPPLGSHADDRAADAFTGPHGDSRAGLRLPMKDGVPLQLSGFGAWTLALGTMYAWYPSASALAAIQQRGYEPDDEEGPWL